VEILIGISVYCAITIVIVRLVQGVHGRDEDMREITARWIEEKRSPTLTQ
jgi:hypothetical protein